MSVMNFLQSTHTSMLAQSSVSSGGSSSSSWDFREPCFDNLGEDTAEDNVSFCILRSTERAAALTVSSAVVLLGHGLLKAVALLAGGGFLRLSSPSRSGGFSASFRRSRFGRSRFHSFQTARLSGADRSRRHQASGRRQRLPDGSHGAEPVPGQRVGGADGVDGQAGVRFGRQPHLGGGGQTDRKDDGGKEESKGSAFWNKSWEKKAVTHTPFSRTVNTQACRGTGGRAESVIK